MDLSNAEYGGEAELHVAKQRQELIRCYTCGRTKHLRPTCPLRKKRPNPMGRNPRPSQKPVMAGKRRHRVGAGCPTGVELGYITSLRGKVKQVIAPQSSVTASTERGYKSVLLVSESTVKGFEKHWSILIDSGASCNYAQRRFVKGVSNTLRRSKRTRVIQSPFF